METESEEIDSPEVERLREDLLDGIDEDSDLCTSIHNLDSFMKSFEEEITTSPTSSHGSGAAEERIGVGLRRIRREHQREGSEKSGGGDEQKVEAASEARKGRPTA
ncbi:hypothetical protein SASPL_137498 [Salvia splendens]|uniref:Uncharacterized protein n=1 Tax=Salvia splendens TaxID=180675 RepID=A0A8X8WTG7_SALSN|nr:hypothetical protein SASPL_137498 [Salvia splendens]